MSLPIMATLIRNTARQPRPNGSSQSRNPASTGPLSGLTDIKGPDSPKTLLRRA